MKIYFDGRGDPSVGIPPGEATIEANIEPEDDTDREQIRELAKSFFEEILNDKGLVTFQDECITCQERLNCGICKTKGCPENQSKEVKGK